MNEQIMHMAREAGVRMDYTFDSGTTRWILHPSLIRFAALVAEAERKRVMNEPINKEHWQRFEDEIRAAEREAILAYCEAVCKAQAGYGPLPGWMQLMDFIRARGSK